MLKKSAIAAALAALTLSAAHAGTIVSAVDATVLAGGPGQGDIADTYNLFGLFNDYVSGVTDFDTFFSTQQLHDAAFDGQEWFTLAGVTATSVRYDLGAVTGIQGMALWNEEGAGIGKLNVSGSKDGVTWFSLLSNLTPTDNPVDTSYAADLYSWKAVELRFVKLDISNCPQPGGTGYPGCSIGEVAFNTGTVTAVPEASTMASTLLGMGLLGVAVRRRRQR